MTMVDDNSKNKQKSQRKILLILSILFLILLLLLTILVLLSFLLVHKNGHPHQWNPLNLLMSEIAIENDLSCVKPDCLETCYEMDNEEARKAIYFALNENFTIAKTELKIQIRVNDSGSLVQIHMISPKNRLIWNFGVKLMRNVVIVKSQVSDHKLKLDNVTSNIRPYENFFIYAKPVLNGNHTVAGFHFDIQPQNQSKISLGEISMIKLDQEEMTGHPTIPYHFEKHGPSLIYEYCTITKTQ